MLDVALLAGVPEAIGPAAVQRSTDGSSMPSLRHASARLLRLLGITIWRLATLCRPLHFHFVRRFWVFALRASIVNRPHPSSEPITYYRVSCLKISHQQNWRDEGLLTSA